MKLLHPSLQFTFEKECNQFLPFLDVMIKKVLPKFITSTENPLSQSNTFVGILVALKNGKLT